jgi:hypothetical protein
MNSRGRLDRLLKVVRRVKIPRSKACCPRSGQRSGGGGSGPSSPRVAAFFLRMRGTLYRARRPGGLISIGRRAAAFLRFD